MNEREAVLEHLARYRFTTVGVLHKTLYSAYETAQFHKHLASRIHNRELPLEPRFIGPRIPVLQQENRGKIGLVTAWSRWALLHYCCLRDTPRLRLLPHELLAFLHVDRLPGFDPNTQFFCLDINKRTIAQVIVDFRPSISITSPVKHSMGHDLARRICERWQRFQTVPCLSELHAAGLLGVTALVATESKKALVLQSIKQEIATRPSLMPGKPDVSVVPELFTLIQ